MNRYWCVFWWSLFACSAVCRAETITLLGNDLDDEYQMALLQLALDNSTEPNSRDFTLALSPPMGDKRALETVKSGRYPNPIRVGIPGMAAINMDFIQFPTQLGALGYRICFHR